MANFKSSRADQQPTTNNIEFAIWRRMSLTFNISSPSKITASDHLASSARA